jgi:hypothetical protein
MSTSEKQILFIVRIVDQIKQDKAKFTISISSLDTDEYCKVMLIINKQPKAINNILYLGFFQFVFR